MEQNLDSWKNFNKMDKPLARLIRAKEKTQIMSTRKKNEETSLQIQG